MQEASAKGVAAAGRIAHRGRGGAFLAVAVVGGAPAAAAFAPGDQHQRHGIQQVASQLPQRRMLELVHHQRRRELEQRPGVGGREIRHVLTRIRQKRHAVAAERGGRGDHVGRHIRRQHPIVVAAPGEQRMQPARQLWRGSRRRAGPAEEAGELVLLAVREDEAVCAMRFCGHQQLAGIDAGALQMRRVVAVGKVLADEGHRQRLVAEQLQGVGDVHGAAAEAALEAAQLHGQIDAGMARQGLQHARVGADRVDGQRTGEQDAARVRGLARRGALAAIGVLVALGKRRYRAAPSSMLAR